MRNDMKKIFSIATLALAASPLFASEECQCEDKAPDEAVSWSDFSPEAEVETAKDEAEASDQE
jgi:hypothetical protein